MSVHHLWKDVALSYAIDCSCSCLRHLYGSRTVEIGIVVVAFERFSALLAVVAAGVALVAASIIVADDLCVGDRSVRASVGNVGEVDLCAGSPDDFPVR
jgi:hypothetical protein